MSKGNPYLKKATGAAKVPVAADKRKHGLGRSVDFGGAGVSGLLGATPAAVPGQPLELKIADIERSPYQPRREFREEELRELAESLKNNGLVGADNLLLEIVACYYKFAHKKPPYCFTLTQ